MIQRKLVDPTELQLALLAKLRSIPALVAELNDDPQLINAYIDVYPENTSLEDAIFRLKNPEAVVAFVAMMPTSFNNVQYQAYLYNVYFRAGNGVDHPAGSGPRMMNAMLWGHVGDTGVPLNLQLNESWIDGMFFEIQQIPTFLRQQDREGRDLWQMSLEIVHVF